MQQSPSYMDKIIYDYIQNNADENYDHLIADDSRKEVQYQLSSRSASSIAWYPFEKGISILQIEAGFGATTGKLCDIADRVVVIEHSVFYAEAVRKRYQNRKNLEVIMGSVEELEITERFDYIVVLGELERIGQGNSDENVYVQYIKSVIKWLKPEGKLLLAVENLYGISNWCGKRETYTKIPFEGIAGYPEGTEGRGFHQKQLQNILQTAGLVYHRFFYPMPDYRKVYDVFSDDRLPNKEMLTRLKGQFDQDATYLFDEMNVLYDIAENGTFPFFANSFFVEAGRTPQHRPIDYEQFSRKVNASKSQEEPLPESKQNRNMLRMKGKSKSFVMDKDEKLIQQVMKIQLELLGQLDYVCKKYGLQMYMIYGTLLGAVRHNGVIPGDDDIDVALPREDYNRLLELVDEFQGEYFLQTPWNDNCFYGGYLKLRKRDTTAINPQNWWVDCCEGIGIDIFPLDDGYCNKVKEWWKEKRICFYQRLLYAKTYGYFIRFRDMPFLIWKGYRYLGKPFTRKQLADRLDKIMASGDNSTKAPYGIFAHYTAGKRFQRFSRKAFETSVLMRYEDMLLDAPAGYDDLLSKRYGKDYMNYPPYREDKQRHGFYAPDVPYVNYKKRFNGLFRPEPQNQDIILVGDEVMFRVYLKNQKKKFQPKYFIDLYGTIEDQSIDSVPIRTLEFLNSVDRSKVYLVICCADIRKAENEIRKLGYRDYFIYVEDRGWILLANPEYILKAVEHTVEL